MNQKKNIVEKMNVALYRAHPWHGVDAGPDKHLAEITHTYAKEEAYEVIRRGRRDYDEKFGSKTHTF